MIRARISALGAYVPDKVLTNFDLERMVDTSDEWITQRTGIKERRIAESVGVGTSTLAYEASLRALAQAELEPDDIDLIIMATISPDFPVPASASILQKRLGNTRAAAFDLGAACSGYIYGLAVAEQFVKTGQYRRVLLVGADQFSNRLNWNDRETCVLFGDGAGATIIEPSDNDQGILSCHLHSDGTKYDLLWMEAGGSYKPITGDVLANGAQYLRMAGKEMFKTAVSCFYDVCEEAMQANGLTLDDVDIVVPHQANARIIEAFAKKARIPMEKVIVNIDKYANTIAGTIPIALDEGVRCGRIRDGSLVLLTAFGGGLTWASALIRW